MPSLNELETELEELEGKIFGMEQTAAANRAADLTNIITAKGKLKGELTGLTVKQHRDLIGRFPDPKLIRELKEKGKTRIPWELILDQLAGERGFSDGDKLKEAIEDASDAQGEIESLKRQRNRAVSEITEKIKKGFVGVDKIVIERQSKLFPDENVKAEVTNIDGDSVTAVRNPSNWIVELDKGKDGIIEQRFRVRFAVDARKLVRAAVKDVLKEKGVELQKLEKKATRVFRPKRQRISAKSLRITPKQPALRK